MTSLIPSRPQLWIVGTEDLCQPVGQDHEEVAGRKRHRRRRVASIPEHDERNLRERQFVHGHRLPDLLTLRPSTRPRQGGEYNRVFTPPVAPPAAAFGDS